MGGDNQQTDDQFFHLLILYRVSLIALFSPAVIGCIQCLAQQIDLF
jgi:hypothetical protein